MKKEVQEVDVAVSVSGYYAAWHELSIRLKWDYTNDKKTDFTGSREEADEALDTGHDGEYSDCEMKKAVLIDGEYYVKL